METESIACQIARAQISRYVAGDDLGEDTIVSLEAHIAECDECRLEVDTRRIELQASLAGNGSAEPEEAPAAEIVESEPATSDRRSSRKGAAEDEPQTAPEPETVPIAAPEQMEVPAFVKPEPSLDTSNKPAPSEQAPEKRADESELPAREKVPLIAMIRARLPKLRRAKSEDKVSAQTEAKTETKPDSPEDKTNWKPLIYSGALAAVLITMSAFVQNPTSVFGERAIKPGEKPSKKSEGKAEELPKDKADSKSTDSVKHSAKQHTTEGESGTKSEPESAKASALHETMKAPDHEQAEKAATGLTNDLHANTLTGTTGGHESGPTHAATAKQTGTRSSAKPPGTTSKPPTATISTSKAHRTTVHKTAPVRKRPHVVRRPRPASLTRSVKPRPKSSGNSIRVYDHDGKPIPTHSGE